MWGNTKHTNSKFDIIGERDTSMLKDRRQVLFSYTFILKMDRGKTTEMKFFMIYRKWIANSYAIKQEDQRYGHLMWFESFDRYLIKSQ